MQAGDADKKAQTSLQQLFEWSTQDIKVWVKRNVFSGKFLPESAAVHQLLAGMRQRLLNEERGRFDVLVYELDTLGLPTPQRRWKNDLQAALLKY